MIGQDVKLKTTRTNDNRSYHISSKKIDLGIMAIEEAFDKQIIKNNNRNEGIIIAFDESFLWEDRKKQFELNLPRDARDKRLQSIKSAPIKLFNENYVLSSKELHEQFNIASQLLDAIRKNQLKLSEVFDIDKLSLFVALNNLFGGMHGLISHNIRVYYNPITKKLEPISFDSNAGQRLKQIINYPFLNDDLEYQKKLVEKLELISNNTYLNQIIENQYNKLDSLSLVLSQEFNTATMDLSILEHNSNFIKKKLYPSTTLKVNYVKMNPNKVFLQVKNLSDFPVVISSLTNKKNTPLSDSISFILDSQGSSEVEFAINNSFKEFFSINNVEDFNYPKDLEKLQLKFKTLGLSIYRSCNIIPYTVEVKKDLIEQYKKE